MHSEIKAPIRPWIVEDLRELVGNTPLLRLKHYAPQTSIALYAKLELWNPGGSVKDRIGLAMVEGAIQRGELTHDTVIVEATAGNTGIGLALAVLQRGLRLILVVPEKFSVEKQQLMRALGAELVVTPREQGMKGAMERAEAIRRTLPKAISLRQFENADNVAAHYQTTGPEIYSALGDRITHFVAGAGSGGTFTGVTRYLKERLPNIKAILAEPLGSTMTGGEEGAYEIEGIGNSFVPDTMDLSLIDAVYRITDQEALEAVRQVALKEGLIVGSSSGAALVAAKKLSDDLTAKGQQATIAVLLPDRGDRYFSKGLYTMDLEK